MKRLFVLFLAIVLMFFSTPFSISAYANLCDEANSTTTDAISDNIMQEEAEPAKLHFYIDSNERYYDVYDYKVCVEAFEYMKQKHKELIFDSELIKITIKFNNDFTETEEFKANTATLKSARNCTEELSARKKLNCASKEYHNMFAEENFQLLREFGINGGRAIDYSPYIELRLPINDINIYQFINLAENERILDIAFSFLTSATAETSWNTVLDEIGASDIVDDGTYTGEGVRIGILEVDGVCNVNHKNLKGKNITIKNEADGVSDHATAVTSVIALMVPDAELYVYGFDDEFNLGWFIDNSCSVINCSFGDTGNTQNADLTYNDGVKAYRTDFDGIFDYVIRAHHIAVVVAAGNVQTNNTKPNYNPQGKITSPGYAYNAITVGGIKRTWSMFSYNLEYDEGAAYVSNVPYAKPEISAFYSVNIPNIGECNGTSFSAPQVTASVAILVERNSIYDQDPTRIKAALMANTQITEDYAANKGNFDDRVGAGCLNVQSMLDNSSRAVTYSVTSGSSSGTQIASISLSLSTGQDLQVGLAWYMYYLTGNTAGYLTNYDLRILNSSGSIVARSSIAGYSNVEMLRYTATSSGVYRIVIYQTGSMNSNIPGEKVSVAYRVYDQ